MEPYKDWVKLLPEWKLRELTDIPQLAEELDQAISEWSMPVELRNPIITLEECDQYWSNFPPLSKDYDRLLAAQKRQPLFWGFVAADEGSSTREPFRFICDFAWSKQLKELRCTLQETRPYSAWSVENHLFNYPFYEHLTFSDLRAIRLEWLKQLKEKLDELKWLSEIATEKA